MWRQFLVPETLVTARLISVVARDNVRSACLARRLGCVAAEAMALEGVACTVFEHPVSPASRQSLDC